MSNSGAKIRVIVRNEQPILISSDLIPTTGSVGAAATALSADTATSASFALTASLAQKFEGTATGSFTGSFTGSLLGTASIALISVGGVESASFAISASFAQSASVLVGAVETASYVAGGNVDGAVALATSASGVAYDDVTAKPTLVSSSIQIDHNVTTNFDTNEHFSQSAITEVGTVVAGDVGAILPTGTVSASAQVNTGSFTGSFFGAGEGLTGVDAETASYVAGANVDGVVANATSASDVAFDDVRDKPALVSASIQIDHDATTNFDLAEHFSQSAITEVGTVITGDVSSILPTGTVSASAQINTGSFIGSFKGDGSEITGVVSVSHANNSDTAVLAVSAVTALTSSYIAGANVDGVVASATSASHALRADVADSGTGSFTGSFNGGINLTDNSNQSSSQFVHQRIPTIAQSSDFTISFDDGQTQVFAISASLQFEIQDMQPGGFYIVEFENEANHLITLPSAAPLVFHDSTPVTSSAATGALDVYGFYHRGPNTLMTIIGQDIG